MDKTLLTIEHVRAAMTRPLPGVRAQLRMAPSPRAIHPPEGSSPRQAGVLLLLYPVQSMLHLVLTIRTTTLNHHSGQIALPGGGWEVGDRSFLDTALREAREEFERSLIQRALRQNKMNVSRTASALGISRPTLYDTMRKLGITQE